MEKTVNINREIEREISVSRANALYGRGITGLFGITIAMMMYSAFSWYRLDHQILFSWIGALSTSIVLRLFITYIFQRRNSINAVKSVKTETWVIIFYLTLLLSGAIWASIAFFPYSDTDITMMVFAVLVLVSLNASAIALYSHSFIAMAAYISIAIIPITAALFLKGTYESIVLGMASLSYYIILMRIIHDHNRTLLDNIRLAITNRNHSLLDPLTGLGNRRRLEIFVEKLVPISSRSKNQFSVALFDVDHFKKYNDSYGHHNGDVVLCAIAEIIKEKIRQSDLAIRFGGEELLVVMPETDVESAMIIAERICDEVSASTDVTLSGGVAIHHESENFDDTVRRADKSLYQAKRNGRDCIECSRPVAV